MAESGAPVLIAGAGLGGLAAGLALLRKGIDVEIFEQSASLGEVGAGVQISANGTTVLFALGLEEDVRRDGVPVTDKEIRLWNSGQSWSLFKSDPLPAGGRYEHPMFTLHRKDLHAMLVRAVRELKADAIHLGRRCVRFEATDADVRLAFEQGPPVAGSILIGADGLHSRIREQLCGPMDAEFTGQLAWRGMVPQDRLTPQMRRLVGTNWVGPNAHVTCYPVQRGEVFNFVGQVDRTDWRVESWVTEGSTEECLADFSGWHPQVRHMIESAPKLFKWALFLRQPLPRWSVGRVTLLGDACHAMLPYLGQGANMALEDGFVLARCLAAASTDPQVALLRYENARRERTEKIVRASAEMARTFHNPALAEAASAQRYVETQWSGGMVRTRYDWIYGYNASTSPI